MTKTILTCLTVVLAVLLTACSSSENNGPMSDVDGTAVVASYEGHWQVGTHNAGDGDMTVYTTGFSFDAVPMGAMLRMIMPHRKVENVAKVGYVVPFENIGYSQHAVYMRLSASSWEAEATIDGTKYRTVVCMVTPAVHPSVSPSATYSKISGVYNMAFPLHKVELYDTDGHLQETVDTNLQVAFVTTSKKK